MPAKNACLLQEQTDSTDLPMFCPFLSLMPFETGNRRVKKAVVLKQDVISRQLFWNLL